MVKGREALRDVINKSSINKGDSTVWYKWAESFVQIW